MRVGQGYDVHRLTEGRELILGGVNIPYEKGLDGHSDADVLVHAAYRPKMAENIADALGLSKDQVSVKATTEEGLGFTGAGQGIAAQAIALLTAVGDRCYDSQIMSFCGAGCSGCCGADNEM